MNVRRKWIAGGVAALALVGTGRLATNEVQLAGAQARTRGLEQIADGALHDRRRLVRLEQQLAEQRRAAADLERQRSSSEQEVAALTSSIHAREAALDELRADSRANAERLKATIEETRGLLSKREQAVSELKELAAQRARALESAQALAAERAKALEQAQALAEQRAQQLGQRKRELAALGDALNGKTSEIEGLRGDLHDVRERAEHSDGVIAHLKSAGVNVARLSGERPMPNVNALVVGVDAEAVPPTVLLDVGRANGIEVKDRLYLIRDGAAVAELEVTEVAPQVSSARIVQGERGLKVRPGEDVSSVRPQLTPP